MNVYLYINSWHASQSSHKSENDLLKHLRNSLARIVSSSEVDSDVLHVHLTTIPRAQQIISVPRAVMRFRGCLHEAGLNLYWPDFSSDVVFFL